MSVRKLNWEADAELQLLVLLEFVGAQNPRAARHIKQLIDDALERACRFPASGRPGRVAGTRELIAHPNYIVVYRISDSGIDVLRLLHARQRYP